MSVPAMDAGFIAGQALRNVQDHVFQTVALRRPSHFPFSPELLSWALLHTGSLDISMPFMCGAVPLNFTVPVIEPPPAAFTVWLKITARDTNQSLAPAVLL